MIYAATSLPAHTDMLLLHCYQHVIRRRDTDTLFRLMAMKVLATSVVQVIPWSSDILTVVQPVAASCRDIILMTSINYVAIVSQNDADCVHMWFMWWITLYAITKQLTWIWYIIVFSKHFNGRHEYRSAPEGGQLTLACIHASPNNKTVTLHLKSNTECFFYSQPKYRHFPLLY